jgi:N-acyl-D-aspartate/D-glutamate deacylase
MTLALILAGGLVVDGTGAAPLLADVHIVDGRITHIAPSSESDEYRGEAEVRDVSGHVVCPGFVDIHTHSDMTLLSNPLAHSKVHQGVTTEVVGNCGLGVAPTVTGTDMQALRASVSYLDLDPAVAWTWASTASYLDVVAGARPSINVAMLTGHIPLHAGVVGFDDRSADSHDRDRMCGLLADSFRAGSVGLSTGLVYSPLFHADADELHALASVVAAHDRVFAWHVRDYGDDLIPSVTQALTTSRDTGCRTEISHLCAVGRRNWRKVAQVLDLVDVARADGVQVGVDIYPYLHGNAPLIQLLPAWAQDGGPVATASRLRERAVRLRIRTEWENRALTWDDVTINWLPAGFGADLVGQNVASLAEAEAVDGDEYVLDLLGRFGSSIMMVAGGRSEDDLRQVLGHPATVVASDGLALDPTGPTGSGNPHPRSYGCFPRYLSRFVEPSGVVDAIRRCTSAPAAQVGLADRGVLAVGRPADVVVFDPATLGDTATFVEPHQFPTGIKLVIVNGEIVVDGQQHTQARSGAVLRGEDS